MEFSEMYGTRLDRALGTEDRTQRFTTARRKAAINEGLAKFNERTGCYIKRATIALTTLIGEYDLEDVAVLADGDYLRPSKTGAVLLMDDGTTITYREGDQFQFITEDELQTRYPGWRGAAEGTPTHWFTRRVGGSEYFSLYVAPLVPAGETWTVQMPYVAIPPTLVNDSDVPYGGRVSLVPYLEGVIAYAASVMEQWRKDPDREALKLQEYGAIVAQYAADSAPPRGARIRMAQDYRLRFADRMA